ncbi:tyrosine-type recombinase/integrase [Mycobacterium sp. TY815]|uniref:tyrosine-type recombinase/integrase n=1 Tax=Mycobacterium sp. TY815 TaxID=3050581 RepID=UPI002741B8C4|nr:tyrosine-type recombinase/integrase [Mycobacterium sp. TY815]MDP7707502.1 tyrosine-type recombinase/integrase [Mycobacterium sp. TY815]
MDVQAVRSPVDGGLSYTVLGADGRMVSEIERYLTHLTTLGKSPNTIRGYARDIADLFEWVAEYGRDWRSLEVEDIGTWVKWLRTPEHARSGAVLVLPQVQPAVAMRTVARKLTAVNAFYVFHARHDEAVRMSLTRWYPGGRRSYLPFLAHVQKGSRRNEIRLRCEPQRPPQIVTRDEVSQLLEACSMVRDRFLLSLLFETGARIGEALGMRHEDLSIANESIRIEPRHNDNNARVKNWKPRSVPVNRELFTLYADYMDIEYGTIDSDYLFVNIFRGQRGHPLTYWTVRELVKRLRRETGLEGFSPHHLRHTFATDLIRRGTDWHVLQLLLGHSSAQTTMSVYGHLTMEDARRALVEAGWLKN